MKLADIFETLCGSDGEYLVDIPPTWHQGRTCYGGLSAAIAYRAANMLVQDLPPLCSAQFAFVGPLSGKVTISARLLRRGKNSAFVHSEVRGENGVGLSATFVFMASRDSHFAFDDMPVLELLPLPEAVNIRSGPDKYFTSNMEYGESRQPLGTGKPLIEGWMRLKSRDGIDPVTQMIAVADALPPAAMGMMREYGPVSSLNWQFNLIGDPPETTGGWWFLQSRAHFAQNGASSQSMTMCNSEGKVVMEGTQAVAIFA
jgi:hypothetical protein